MIKLLVTDELSEEGLEMLRKGGQVQVEVRPNIPHEELIKIIGDYDALVIRSGTKVTADVIEAGKNLKVVGRAGVGVDNVDVKAATRRGVLVMNTPSANIISAAEHTMAMMLSLARNIVWADSSVKRGEWKRSKFTGIELNGKTLGIVGLGRIGGEVAKRAKSFGMKLIGFDPYVPPEVAVKLGVRIMSMEELIEEADIITIHAALTPTTHHLVSRELIAKLKPNAMIINVARGELVDTDALYEALRDKKIAGAAIDVYEHEPPTGSPLLTLDNAVLTPHLGRFHQGSAGEGIGGDGRGRQNVPAGQEDHQRGERSGAGNGPQGPALRVGGGAPGRVRGAADRRPGGQDPGHLFWGSCRG